MLRPVQALFDPSEYPNLLVGLGHPDDAAVWRLDEDRALILTTDFFTPVVDDAFDYGQIAAANSLSDIYAMGGEPFLALNIAALPPQLPADVSSEILRGGAEKCREAGVVIAGGHSVQDKEPKYGLVVLGFVHPKKILSKGGARPGDVLILTKPLGFGVTTTALKQERADPADVAEVVDWMKKLNRGAAEMAMEFNLHGGTDVTGFSLLGHGYEMAAQSGARLRISYSELPFMAGAQAYAEDLLFPAAASIAGRGGTRWATQVVVWNRGSADTAGATVDATVVERLLPTDWIVGISPTTNYIVGPGKIIAKDDPIGDEMGGTDTSGARSRT